MCGVSCDILFARIGRVSVAGPGGLGVCTMAEYIPYTCTVGGCCWREECGTFLFCLAEFKFVCSHISSSFVVTYMKYSLHLFCLSILVCFFFFVIFLFACR